MGTLAAVIEDINKDRDSIVNSVRDRLNEMNQFRSYNSTNYQLIREAIEEKVKALNLQHKDLDKKIYHGKSWTELVGIFLKLQKIVGYDNLKYKLDFKSFKFQEDEKELSSIVGNIKTAKKLYSEINRLDHPLEILKDNVFQEDNFRAVLLDLELSISELNSKSNILQTEIDRNKDEYNEWLADYYQSLYNKCNELKTQLQNELDGYKKWMDNYYDSVFENYNQLQNQLINDLDAYKNELKQHFENVFNELNDKIIQFQEFVKTNEDCFGNEIYENNWFAKLKISLLSSLFSRYKKLKNSRRQLLDDYSVIEEIYNKTAYFNHEFVLSKEFESFKIYTDNIEKIGDSLNNWYIQIDILIEKNLSETSSSNLHTSCSNLIPKIKETEYGFKKFADNISLDKSFTCSNLETSNHKSKIDFLNYLGINNQEIDKIKDVNFQEFRTRKVHYYYTFQKEKVIEAEIAYYELIKYVSLDDALSFQEENSDTFLNKIENLEKLSLKIKHIENYHIPQLDEFSSTQHHIYFDNLDSILKVESKFGDFVLEIASKSIISFIVDNSFNHSLKMNALKEFDSNLKLISDNLSDFREYFEWRRFYINLPGIQRVVVRSIIETGTLHWEKSFESWYYYWMLSLAETELKQLPKSEDKIIELVDSKKDLKINQIGSIVNNWSSKQRNSIRNSQSRGISAISLFNKRGSRGERRNSIRKIIRTDFQLFTDFFPVLMISPSVCSSILPLDEGLFDIVIFDEASQLRLEDTFPALMRGKIKIISGDSQQMPPSNFFQGGSALLNPTEEDYDEELSNQENELKNQKAADALDLADSESLLVYAENCNYKQSYLKIHYRSRHPHLIDFSNHAFYGKRLIPMPQKEDYVPIKFIDVAGVYEDQVNKDEAARVVDILVNEIKPQNNGKYPSVGIATFNLYQRNLILEEISLARQQSPSVDKKISDLGSDLFVKNLENIQGDERDIIIISTTFGKKKDGSFRQNFGPILQNKGYKLLNVIVTRAKHQVYVCCSIPQVNINQYSTLLQENKNTGRGVFYAYLAYAKSVSEKNDSTRDEILNQLYNNCESKSFDLADNLGSESPFEEEVFNALAQTIGAERIQQQFKIGGFRIDLVVKAKNADLPLIAIECDGAKYHDSEEAYAWDIFRQKQLEEHGFIFYRIWSTNWWYSEEKETRKLVDFINKIDEERHMTIPFN
ncbi:MAG: AAA domain-containing protein [Bacteroidales bacterium]